MLEKIEDTRGVIRSSKTDNTMTNNNIQNTTQIEKKRG